MIRSTIFKKTFALDLFIPPHSAHPPGVLLGHIHGNILRINQLCSGKDDVTNIIQTFVRWLVARGHKPPTLLTIFDLALDNARKFIAMTDGAREEACTTKCEESK